MHGPVAVATRWQTGARPRYARQLRHLADPGAGHGAAPRLRVGAAGRHRTAACTPVGRLPGRAGSAAATRGARGPRQSWPPHSARRRLDHAGRRHAGDLHRSRYGANDGSLRSAPGRLCRHRLSAIDRLHQPVELRARSASQCTRSIHERRGRARRQDGTLAGRGLRAAAPERRYAICLRPRRGASHSYRPLLADPEVHSVALTTEEEGIALLAGADRGGARGVLLLQSSGVGNCINMLSLASGGQFPFLLLVSMRSDFGEGNPWQYPMGRATQPVLEAMGGTCLRADNPDEALRTVAAALT